jgi:serine/threonine-protein kinase RsbW
MTTNGQHIVRLEFTSAFEMLDFVQVVSDHMARDIGLDDDALHWVGVAIRESVINAIKHGNRNDADKHVFIEFETETVANPLDPENLLKSSGRGIFLIRNFMDDVQLQRAPEGGMEIRMVKRVQASAE